MDFHPTLYGADEFFDINSLNPIQAGQPCMKN